MARDQQEFAAICQELVDQTPDSIDAPGGESRDSMLAHFGEQSLIVTHREHALRVCGRIRSWAAQTSLLAGWDGWLGELEAAIPN